MKRGINISIKQRIYWSFSLLVCLIVLNGIITIHTINNNKKLSAHLSKVVEPSIQAMEDFESVLVESKMYTTNWVFLRFNREDKEHLKKLHDSGYPALKSGIKLYSSQWENKNWVDSLNRILTGFEHLLAVEKKIMTSLKEAKDYDDPVILPEAERQVEEEILPRTAALMKSLKVLHSFGVALRTEENSELERSSGKLMMFIMVSVIILVLTGFVLSVYMTRLIIGPVNSIRHIIHKMGQGIFQKADHHVNGDEIGKMVSSVNYLSEKLESIATFAHETGLRNFDIPFKPLSDEDTLGKALIAMRDKIKSEDEKLNDAQHIAHLGSWERNIKTKQLYLSDEMFEIFDIDPVSFDGRFQSILELIHPADIETFNSIRRKYMNDRRPAAYECRIVTSKGVIKNIFVQSEVVADANGEVIKTIGIVHDITERKKAEEKLAPELELFRLMIENIPDQIYVKDTESRFLLCNIPGAINAGCKSQADIIGKTDFDFYPPEIAKHFFDVEQALMKSGKPIISQEDYVPDEITGEPRWSLNTKVPIKDRNGKMIGLIGINRDITQIKISEKKIEDVNRELSILFNSINEIFFSVNITSFKVIQISATCEKVYGYKQSDFMDNYRLWFDIIHPDDRHVIENEDEEMRRGKEVNNQYRIIRKDKTIRWVETKIIPTLNAEGELTRVDGITRDITGRKTAELALLESQASLAINNYQLEQKNKELEQFAYVASHDLQEPLRTTISFVEIFKKQYFGKLDPKADKYLSYIIQASDRMKVLIEDLLDFSRIGINKEVEKVDCNIILHDIIIDLDKAIKESGAEIITDHLPVISGYTTELKQLFQNLIINSIKFRKKNVPPEINITAQRKNDYWRFAFTDNGIGIDQQHSERIFIIFQRLHTRAAYGGSGIGLSHCKKIVELHHGKIWVESTLNGGSTFYFTIHSPKEKINEPKIELHNAY